MAAQKPPSPSEVALAEAQNLLQLWMNTKSSFAKANSEEEITREDEQSFLETKSEISRYQRTLTPKLPEGVTFGADRMQELLRQSISIGHLRNLPKVDRTNLLVQWHYVFVFLSRAVGAMQFMTEGYVPPPRVKSKGGSNISELKKGVGGKGGEGGSKAAGFFKVVIALVLIGGAIYFLMKRLG